VEGVKGVDVKVVLPEEAESTTGCPSTAAQKQAAQKMWLGVALQVGAHPNRGLGVYFQDFEVVDQKCYGQRCTEDSDCYSCC